MNETYKMHNLENEWDTFFQKFTKFENLENFVSNLQKIKKSPVRLVKIWPEIWVYGKWIGYLFFFLNIGTR